MAQRKGSQAKHETNGHPKGSAAAVQAELARLGSLFADGDKMAREEPERLIRHAHHLLVNFRACGSAIDTLGSQLSEIGATIAGRPPAHLSAAWLKRGRR